METNKITLAGEIYGLAFSHNSEKGLKNRLKTPSCRLNGLNCWDTYSYFWDCIDEATYYRHGDCRGFNDMRGF